MKRIFLTVACVSTLLLSACGGDTKLPTPTGKGAIRMINAIPDGPNVAFLIEETVIGGAGYKESSSPVSYDDFDYNFNFEIVYPGSAGLTRIATQALKVETARDHIFVLTGDISAPTIIVWNGDQRSFAEGETVFEARFSHASVSLGDIDVYFDAAGTVLGTNLPVATLAPGAIADAADFEAGSYVMTITAAGDIDTVHYTSAETSLVSQFAHVMTVYDGDANDTAPITVRSMTSVGNPLSLPDATYPPKTRFIHTSYTLETVDIYNDELLTNLFVPGLEFQVATDDLDTSTEAETYYYTPENSQATVLFNQEHGPQDSGTNAHIYLIGDTDNWRVVRFRPERSSSSVSVKLRVFQGALNYDTFALYRKARGEPLEEDDTPFLVSAYSFQTGIALFEEGSYDLYVTELDTKTEIMAAPYEIDVVLGDVVDMIAVDTMDPALIELIELPVP